MHVLAVIPARGGSKSIPLKNIRPLNGIPLLAFTIQAAKRSAYLDRYVVSTDHADIVRVAREYGAEVIERPADLATDQAPTEWALLHALEVLARQSYRPEFVVTLEPTSPLRSTELIDRCIAEAIRHPEMDCVMPATVSSRCFAGSNTTTVTSASFDTSRRAFIQSSSGLPSSEEGMAGHGVAFGTGPTC